MTSLSVDADPSDFGAPDELARLSESENFISWIFDELEPNVGERVLEVGAGLGAITRRLLDSGRSVTALEPAANIAPVLRSRMRGEANLEIIQCTSAQLAARDSGRTFDSVVYVSVLEHIADDVSELRTAIPLLKPGGTVAIFVPAMQSIYGSLDRKSGHFRRYSRKGLSAVISESGLQLQSIRWMDTLGVIPYFLMYRVLRRSSLGASTAWMHESLLVPMSRGVERIIGHPRFGKNLIAIAERPDDPSGVRP